MMQDRLRQTAGDRIVRNSKDDWDGRCRLLGYNGVGTCRYDNVDLQASEFGRDLRGAFWATFRPAILDCDSATLVPLVPSIQTEIAPFR
jgi:hypothetical protein